METTTYYYALGGIAASLIFIFGLLLFLFRANAKLRRDYWRLTNSLARQGNDLAGVCAAGVNIDRMLMEHDQRLRGCLERVESLSAWDEANHPYHAAIEKIRKGAKAQDLVAEFGLSPAEASLLARLHGLSAQSLERGEMP